MEKTKLGVTVSALAAATYLFGLFDGLGILMIAVVGQILLFEKNDFLKKNAVRALVVMLFFSLLSTFVNFIPRIIELITVWDMKDYGGFSDAKAFRIINDNIIAFILDVIFLFRIIAMVVLAIVTFKGKDAKLPVVEGITNKCFGIASAQNTQVYRCPKCGAPLTPGSDFCGACGNKLK